MPTIEERLAALETKLDALTETTPTTYYEHQYSGEEIDNAVSRALPNGAIDQSVGTFTRPNLLDNWYFGRPVNQRGQTEYTGNVYTVDRWCTDIANGGAVLVGSNGITLTAQGMYWGERLSNIAALSGRTMTASVLMSDGSLFCGTVVIAWTLNVPQSFFNNDLIHVYANKIGDDRAQFEIASSAANVSILAAKLELGPTQTLAHQENGNWVLNEVPKGGDELRECQRYHLLLPGIYWLPQNADGTNRLTIPIPEMRTIPAVTYEPADGSTGTLYYDAKLAQKNSIQFYAIGVTGICGVKNIRISADL